MVSAANNPNIPLELQEAAARTATQAGVKAGVQLAPQFLSAVGTGMAAKIAANPQTSTQRVLEQIQQSLNALMQPSAAQGVSQPAFPNGARLLEQPGQSPAAPAELDPILLSLAAQFAQLGFDSATALDCAKYAAAGTDPALLIQMTTLFKQVGFEPAVAFDYGRFVTPSYQESRPLAPEEIGIIKQVLDDPNIQTLVETATAQMSAPLVHQPSGAQMQQFQEPPLPQWVRLATESSLVVRGLAIVIGGWLIWQMAASKPPGSVNQVEQPTQPVVQPTVVQPTSIPVQSPVQPIYPAATQPPVQPLAQPALNYYDLTRLDPSTRRWAECQLANQAGGINQSCVQ